MFLHKHHYYNKDPTPHNIMHMHMQNKTTTLPTTAMHATWNSARDYHSTSTVHSVCLGYIILILILV